MQTLELLLQRKIHNAASTEGNLLIDNNWFCHTIEDVVRAKPNEWKPSLKVYGKTAIPYGRYQVLVTYSNRFKRDLTAVLNVPDFEGIRIHNGVNETSSAGCIIVSYKAEKGRLINDRKAMNDLCDKVQAATKTGKKCWITITD
jgi:hypothetical protein